MSIFALPQRCLLCGLRADAPLCHGCRADLPPLPALRCPICAVPLPAPAPACGACLAHPPAYGATCAAWRYGYPLDALIHLLKFGHAMQPGRFAAAAFLASGLLDGDRPAGDLLVPVPLAPRRLRDRGFNQALELARPLAHALGLPLDVACLSRARDTPPQSRLPWRARQRNVRHAFACHADLSGREIIVVDDVMTSGATLDAVARTLKDHGAARVTNWVAARAVRGTT